MTDDTTEQPRTLKVFTCINHRHPTRSCYGLVEDTDEARAKHRAWHLEEENGRKAQQGAIKARDEEIARLKDAISGYRRDVAVYEREVAGFHGEVQRVEAPAPQAALEINRDGYTDDELDDEPEPDTTFTATTEDTEPVEEPSDQTAQQAPDGTPDAFIAPGIDPFSGVYTPAHNPYTGLSG